MQKLSDFEFPSRGKCRNWVILNFPLGGNAIFGWFWFSPGWGNAVFGWFWLSQGWEMRFLGKNGRFTPVSEQNYPIFDDLPPYLSRITRFLTIYSRIWTELPDFWRFTPVSEQNRPISDDLPPYLGGFFRFSVHRRPTTASFCEFLLIVGVRNAIFHVFYSS